jgi:hypothetical protein
VVVGLGVSGHDVIVANVDSAYIAG